MVNTKSQTSPTMAEYDLIQDSRLVLNTKDLTEEKTKSPDTKDLDRR